MKKTTFLCLFLVLNLAGYSQSDSLKKNNNYIGINITRMTVGDFELEMMHQLSNRFIVGIAAGYDFNFPDKLFKEDYNKTETFESESEEQRTGTDRRYFWGQGFAARLHIDYTFAVKQDRMQFISLEGLWKERNYTDHFFGEDRLVYLESADQTIKGLTLYYGSNYKLKKQFVLQIHTGIGFRVLNSNVSRPGYNFQGIDYPPSKLTEEVALPSIHLGVTILKNF